MIVYAFPGHVTAEALAALRQARTPFFSDAYSPALPTLWRVLELVVAGPLGMLLLQVALVTGGTYALLRPTWGGRRAAWLTSALLVFPPVTVSIATIGPPSLALAFLVVGVAGLRARVRVRFLAGLLALTLAVAIWPTAALAACALLVMHFGWRMQARGAARWAPAVLVPVLVIITALGLDALFAKRPIERWHTGLAIVDITGTLARTTPPLDDAARTTLLAGTGAGADHRWTLPPDGAAAPLRQRRALATAARALATAHPGAFARQRLALLTDALWLTAWPAATVVPARADPALARRFGVPPRTSETQDAWQAVIRALAAHTPLFAPWLYVLLAGAALAVVRGCVTTRALVVTGLALALALGVTAVDAAYVSVAPVVVCALLALLAALGARRREVTA